jgi:hypothetical protein
LKNQIEKKRNMSPANGDPTTYLRPTKNPTTGLRPTETQQQVSGQRRPNNRSPDNRDEANRAKEQMKKEYK